MAEVGKVMAERLNAAKGPTEILVPLKGWSIYGSKGGSLYDPTGNALLLKELKQNLKPQLLLKEIDAHINEPDFAAVCVNRLLTLLEEKK